jgi:hypothetical protein
MDNVAQAEGQEEKLKQAKGSGDGSLLDIAWVDRNLVVGPHQVDLGEETTTRYLVRIASGMVRALSAR